jgi:general secretion pathway protein D
MRRIWDVALALSLLVSGEAMTPLSAGAQADSVRRTVDDSVSIRVVDADLRVAVSLLARYIDRPVLVASGVTGGKVTLEAQRSVPRSSVERLLRGLVESQGLQLITDTVAGLIRIEPRADAQPQAGHFQMPVPMPLVSAAADLYVIRLRHARATEVAATINALYGKASALGEFGARQETLSEQVRRTQQYQNPRQPATEGPNASGPSPMSPGSLSSDNAIVPDAGSNSLLVRGTSSDVELVQKAVKALDVRPLQVLIEVLIAEVRKDRSLSYGFDVDVPSTTVGSHPSVSVAGTQTGLGLGDFVLRVMRKGPSNFNATLRAAQARGDARILSRPVLLATNNENAEILVGAQRPFVQVQRSLPTDAPSRDQVVQYRDVGTRLIVRPTISGDGFVALQVTQEVNAATSETQFDAPVISTRTVQTRLVVRDSQTVVLGGLSDQQRDRSQGGVPLLSGIPWVGGLFGRAVRRNSETEFFLFLTPRIIRDDEDVQRVTEPFNARAKKEVP